MTNQELAQAIWRYGQENGLDEMAGICARTLVCLTHVLGGNVMEFSCDLGKVNVKPESIPEHKIN